MNDPMQDIEDAKGQRDIGRFCCRVYQGARDEGASRLDALYVVAGVMFGNSKAHEEGNDE